MDISEVKPKAQFWQNVYWFLDYLENNFENSYWILQNYKEDHNKHAQFCSEKRLPDYQNSSYMLVTYVTARFKNGEKQLDKVEIECELTSDILKNVYRYPRSSQDDPIIAHSLNNLKGAVKTCEIDLVNNNKDAIEHALKEKEVDNCKKDILNLLNNP